MDLNALKNLLRNGNVHENIHGGDIYKYENVTDFSANINPMGIPESVREAVVNSLENV